jgi:hypothetical protein
MQWDANTQDKDWLRMFVACYKYRLKKKNGFG